MWPIRKIRREKSLSSYSIQNTKAFSTFPLRNLMLSCIIQSSNVSQSRSSSLSARIIERYRRTENQFELTVLLPLLYIQDYLSHDNILVGIPFCEIQGTRHAAKTRNYGKQILKGNVKDRTSVSVNLFFLRLQIIVFLQNYSWHYVPFVRFLPSHKKKNNEPENSIGFDKPVNKAGSHCQYLL